MHRVDIEGARCRSVIVIGEALGSLPLYAPVDRLIIVTDQTVFGLYGDRFPPVPVIRIGSGETVKTLETVSHVYRELIDQSADRSAWLVGIGGGLVCDLAGFVASTYLRGIAFGFVPTTLLAQVDASVGGKNGVNLDGYKNMVGTFNQPDFVLCDPGPLRTLSQADVGCGLAEIVKHAAIGDAAMFERIEAEPEAALQLEPGLIERLVCDSVRIKADIVQRDERESGDRRLLNFGHTFGHAVEKVEGVPHGQAVAQGMAVASALSRQRGLLSTEDHNRLLTLLGRLHLPAAPTAPPDALLQAVAKDKKRLGENVHFVLLEGIGSAVVEPIPLADIEAAARSLLAGG
jgi:3-dehydroquinate synthase